MQRSVGNLSVMEKRSRLGRGLSSLLSVSDPAIAVTTPDVPIAVPGTPDRGSNPPAAIPSKELREIEVGKITPNSQQPRRQFDEESLKSLAESIRVAGIIQPIVVRQVEDGYQLVAGERRWRAAKIAGVTTIPAIVRSIDPLEQAQLALIENIHREDLNPIDRALAYRSMLNSLGLTHQELATKLGEERSSIANYLRLIDLEESVRNLVATGAISFGHAKLLAGVDNPAEQASLANRVVSEQLSVRSLEKLLKSIEPPAAEAVPPSPNAHIADLERRLSRGLQMRTEVRQAGKAGKGRVVIHYASLDQFDQLLQRLNIQVDD
jgi:ParB family chromosome partitioning protein